MKPNPVLSWRITLRGAKRPQRLSASFTGTLDSALAEADVMECHPRWIVRSVTIVAAKAKRRRAA